MKKKKISNYIDKICNQHELMDNEIKSSGINNLLYDVNEKNTLLKDVYHLKVNFKKDDYVLF